jgi:hypothetical protein
MKKTTDEIKKIRSKFFDTIKEEIELKKIILSEENKEIFFNRGRDENDGGEYIEKKSRDFHRNTHQINLFIGEHYNELFDELADKEEDFYLVDCAAKNYKLEINNLLKKIGKTDSFNTPSIVVKNIDCTEDNGNYLLTIFDSNQIDSIDTNITRCCFFATCKDNPNESLSKPLFSRLLPIKIEEEKLVCND